MNDKGTFKGQVTDFCLLFFIYLAIASIPWGNFLSSFYVIMGVKIGTGAIFLTAIIVLLAIRYPQQKRPIPFINLLFFLPFFLIVFSNFASSYFISSPSNYINIQSLLLNIVSTIIYAIIEEVLFRGFLLPLLLSRLSDFKSLLISSAIFALVHLFNIFSGINVILVLIQVLYTFGIGLILGLMYVYGKTLVLPMLFHICFNVFENDLYEAFYPSATYTNLRVLVTVTVSLFALFYGVFIYFHFQKKEPSSIEESDK